MKNIFAESVTTHPCHFDEVSAWFSADVLAKHMPNWEKSLFQPTIYLHERKISPCGRNDT